MPDNDNLEQALINRALREEATARGALDPDCARLCDRSTIFVSEDGTVYGAGAAVADLLTKKPHFMKQTEKQTPKPANQQQESTLTNVRNLGFEEAERRLIAHAEKYGRSVSPTERQRLASLFPTKTNASPAEAAYEKTNSDKQKTQDWLRKYK